MTISQKEMVKEIAGMAIGMTVEMLMQRIGMPEKHSMPRDMDGAVETLTYQGRIFYAKNGVVYAVYADEGE